MVSVVYNRATESHRTMSSLLRILQYFTFWKRYHITQIKLQQWTSPSLCTVPNSSSMHTVTI